MRKTCILFILIILCINRYAIADQQVEIKPGPSDFTVTEIKEFAAKFFSKKCGLSEEILMNARMNIRFLQDKYLRETDEGKLVWTLGGEPFWCIYIESFPYPYARGNHRGPHVLYLTREGEIIEWAAHGMGYNEEEPDIIKMGTQDVPIEGAAQEDEIIESAKKELRTRYNVEDVESFEYLAAFLYEEHFNDGQIPVWIVYIYNNGELVWKGAFGYNGCFMCLVPAEQDYSVYDTPGETEHFIWAVFGRGDKGRAEMAKYFGIIRGEATEEQIITWVNEIKPLFLEWKKSHLYLGSSSDIDELIQKYGDSETIVENE